MDLLADRSVGPSAGHSVNLLEDQLVDLLAARPLHLLEGQLVDLSAARSLHLKAFPKVGSISQGYFSNLEKMPASHSEGVRVLRSV